MRLLICAVAAVMLSGVAMVGGCASSPYSAAGYTAVEKDGRLYVFVPGSAEHQRFGKTGELGKSVTRVGAGPKKMTIIAEEQVNLEAYLAAVNGK